MMRHGLAPLLLTIFALPATAADPVAVRELRIQKVGDVTYFHVRLAEPRRMPSADIPRNEEQPADAAPAEARLVSPDAKARHIYQRQAAFSSTPIPPWHSKEEKKPREPVPVEGLEFVGKVQAADEITLVLLYSVESQPEREHPRGRTKEPAVTWKETRVTLNLRKAKQVALPAEARTRKAGPTPKQGPENPVRDDLEGLWADAQIAYFSRADIRVEDFGFPTFAAEATARKYNVPNPHSPNDLRASTVTRQVPYTVTRTVPMVVEGRTVYKQVTEQHYREVRSAVRTEIGRAHV